MMYEYTYLSANSTFNPNTAVITKTTQNTWKYWASKITKLFCFFRIINKLEIHYRKMG